MDVATYSADQVNLEVANYKITGFSTIAVARNSPRVSFIKGIRGKNTRVFSKDTSLVLTVNLVQTSIANDVFSNIVDFDINNGSGRLKIALVDKSGTACIRSNNAYIEDYAPLTFSEEIGDREWKIYCLDSYQFISGGNLKSPFDLFKSAVGGFSKNIL